MYHDESQQRFPHMHEPCPDHPGRCYICHAKAWYVAEIGDVLPEVLPYDPEPREVHERELNEARESYFSALSPFVRRAMAGQLPAKEYTR